MTFFLVDITLDQTATKQNSTIDHSVCYTYQTLQTTEDSYNLDTTVFSWTECEDQCSKNSTCKSYSFNSGGSNTCLLSSSTQSVPSGSSTSFFVLKYPCEISMFYLIPNLYQYKYIEYCE